MPKKCTPAEKERAVRLVREQTPEYGSVSAAARVVAARMQMSPETVRTWCKQDEIDSGNTAGLTSEEHAEIRELRAKVRRLEEDNAIVKAAATFFAGELDPRKR